MYKDIDEYRRRKKLKQLATKIVLVGLILGILFVLLNVLQVFKGTRLEDMLAPDTGDTAAFPLTIKEEQLVDLYSMGGNFAVLTKADLLVYNSSGARVNTVIHGYTNPVVKEGTKRLLTYDRGGTKLRVDAASGTVGELTMENNIITAEIAPNGNVAVLMNYKNHAPSVVVYDANLRPIYRAYPSEDFTSAAFSPSGDKLAVCSIDTQNGLLSAKIYEMDITKDTDPVVTEVPDIVPLGIAYQNNGSLIIVGKESLCCLPAGKKRTPGYYTYRGQLQRFAAGSDGTVLLMKDPFSTKSTAVVVNADGKVAATREITEEVLDLYTDGSRLLVLGKKNLYSFDLGLSPMNDPIPLEKSYQKVAYSGENAFVLSADTIERYRIS